jgi:hypothetical protein
MRIAIDCVHYPISPKESSHRSSWASYWKYYLESQGHNVQILYRNQHDKWSEFDAIYLYHGMEFNGKLNLAGGVGEWHINRFKDFAKWMATHEDIPVYSIEHEMPDYYELLKGRKIEILELYGVTDRVKQAHLPAHANQVVIGDSHSLSALCPIEDNFVRVFRNDFKSLNGAITDGFDKYGNLEKASIVSFYFGNIDARHHALRHFDSPTEAAVDYVERYYQEVRRILQKYPNIENVEIIGLLPMPDDSRKIPKSGHYKGTPSYGELQLRQEFVEHFNYFMQKTCVEMGWHFFNWPKHFLDEYENLDQAYMEKPRSVHMSQEAYRYDLRLNRIRYA